MIQKVHPAFKEQYHINIIVESIYANIFCTFAYTVHYSRVFIYYRST